MEQEQKPAELVFSPEFPHFPFDNGVILIERDPLRDEQKNGYAATQRDRVLGCGWVEQSFPHDSAADDDDDVTKPCTEDIYLLLLYLQNRSG